MPGPRARTFIESITLPHPAVPPELEGFTILHLTDFHIRYPIEPHPSRHRWLDPLLADLASVEPDLIALTGDFLDTPEHEPLGLELLRLLSRTWKLKPGGVALATFGNHDTPRFRRAAIALTDELNIAFIGGRVHTIEHRALRILGLDHPEDFLPLLNDIGADATPLITLAHEPTVLIPAAQLKLPIILCGHTHGGQVRLSPRFAPHTSSDTPHHLAAGIIRFDDTLCCISRGLGDGVIEGLRINCPRQAPLYTLHRAPMPGCATHTIPTQVVAW